MPFVRSVTVSATGETEGSGDVPVTGVTVIEACPHLDLGAEIVVAEGMDMPMKRWQGSQQEIVDL